MVGMATDSSYQSGPAGLSAGFQSQSNSPAWLDVQYDNFSVTSP
jgi:hypothetical protein